MAGDAHSKKRRALLAAAGYTPSTAAAILGLGANRVSSELNGGCESRRTRELLADLIGVEFKELWPDDAPERPDIRKRKEYIRAAGLTQRELAKKIGVKETKVSDVIHDRARYYFISVAMAHYLGIQYSELFGEVLKPPTIGQCRKLAECLGLYFCTGKLAFVTLDECGPQCRKNCDRARLIEP